MSFLKKPFDSGISKDFVGNNVTAEKLVISDLSYPTKDGYTGQMLITDGEGKLYFSTAPVPIMPFIPDFYFAKITSNSILREITSTTGQIVPYDRDIKKRGNFSTVSATISNPDNKPYILKTDFSTPSTSAPFDFISMFYTDGSETYERKIMAATCTASESVATIFQLLIPSSLSLTITAASVGGSLKYLDTSSSIYIQEVSEFNSSIFISKNDFQISEVGENIISSNADLAYIYGEKKILYDNTGSIILPKYTSYVCVSSFAAGESVLFFWKEDDVKLLPELDHQHPKSTENTPYSAPFILDIITVYSVPKKLQLFAEITTPTTLLYDVDFHETQHAILASPSVNKITNIEFDYVVNQIGTAITLDPATQLFSVTPGNYMIYVNLVATHTTDFEKTVLVQVNAVTTKSVIVRSATYPVGKGTYSGFIHFEEIITPSTISIKGNGSGAAVSWLPNSRVLIEKTNVL